MCNINLRTLQRQNKMIIVTTLSINNDSTSFCFKNRPIALVTAAITINVTPYIIELLNTTISTIATITVADNV